MSGSDIPNSRRRPKLGLAIVGCGQIVTHHVGAMASALAEKLELRAVCDPSETRREAIQELVKTQYADQLLPTKANGSLELPRHFDTLDDLMSSSSQNNDFFAANIDILFIAVPHDLHETLAMQALSSDKIVVMEKPLAHKRNACDRLVQVSENLLAKSAATHDDAAADDDASRLPAVFIIAEQSPYWQEVALAREMIADGNAIGTIVTAASYYYESMRDNVTSGSVDEAGGLGWRGSLERAGGGITMDGGLHWIRPIREMLGRRIEKVVAIVRRNLAPELQMEGESVAHALFQMADAPNGTMEPDGAGPLVATYSCNMLATAPMAHDTCPYFRITGTKGELVIHGDGLFREEPGAGGLRLYNDVNPKGLELFPEDRKGAFFLGFAGLWKEIYSIGSSRNYAAAHESVVRAADDVRVVLAMYKSAKNASWETV